MGWQPGRGLGRHLQGVTKPVKAARFPARSNTLSGSLNRSPIRFVPASRPQYAFENVASVVKKNESPRRLLPEVSVRLPIGEVYALIDTGSEVTCLRQEEHENILALRIQPPTLPVPSTQLRGVVGQKSLKISRQALIPVKFGQSEEHVACLIVKGLIKPLILGSDWLHARRASIDYPRRTLSFDTTYEHIQLSWETNEVTAAPKMVMGAAVETVEIDIDALLLERAKLACLGESGVQRLVKLLREHRQIFREQPGRTSLYRHHIVMMDSTTLVKRSYPVSVSLDPL